jgi:hypothetical protein
VKHGGIGGMRWQDEVAPRGGRTKVVAGDGEVYRRRVDEGVMVAMCDA